MSGYTFPGRDLLGGLRQEELDRKRTLISEITCLIGDIETTRTYILSKLDEADRTSGIISVNGGLTVMEDSEDAWIILGRDVKRGELAIQNLKRLLLETKKLGMDKEDQWTAHGFTLGELYARLRIDQETDADSTPLKRLSFLPF